MNNYCLIKYVFDNGYFVNGDEEQRKEIELIEENRVKEKEKLRERTSKRFKGVPKSEETKKKMSEAIKGKKRDWVADKINKNPEKIEKTRLKHLGMKRSKSACENIKNAIRESIKRKKENGTYVNGIEGKRMYHNIKTDEEKYFSDEEYENLVNKNEWEYGWSNAHRNKIDKNKIGVNKGRVFINKDGILKRVKKEELDEWLNNGWIKGRNLSEYKND